MWKDPKLFKLDELVSKSLIVCVYMHAHSFTIIEYLCINAYVYK